MIHGGLQLIPALEQHGSYLAGDFANDISF